MTTIVKVETQRIAYRKGMNLERAARGLLVIAGLFNFVVAAGLAFQMEWATSFWPLPDGRFTLLFWGAVLAAIGVAVLWVGLRREWAALPAGALNLLVMMGGISVFLFTFEPAPDQASVMPPSVIPFAIGAGIIAVVNLCLFFWSPRPSTVSIQKTPMLVRFSFTLFAVVLLIVGAALALKTPNIMPWPLKPETSVMIGWIFIGDCFYFLYALLRPDWPSARAQLWSFLVYDLVLIVPFVAHIQTVPPHLRVSLILYIAVLVYSGLLAIYFLFIHQATRIWLVRS